jgi:hypothetical protein
MGQNFIFGYHRLILVALFLVVIGNSSLLALFVGEFFLAVLIWDFKASAVAKAFFFLEHGLI